MIFVALGFSLGHEDRNAAKVNFDTVYRHLVSSFSHRERRVEGMLTPCQVFCSRRLAMPRCYVVDEPLGK
jgi:hypothetical protein